MLETISQGFSTAKNLLRGVSVLNENNIADALKTVRLSLLEADVEYSVVNGFISQLKEKALGLNIKTSLRDKKGRTHKLSPSEHFIGICHEELIALMGNAAVELNLDKNLSCLMMVGLQGSGKTTTSAKLANLLVNEKKKRPLLVGADIYRPAAAQQLNILGQRLNIPVFHRENASAEEICEAGLKKARELNCDVVIFDTAGRLAIDEKLMSELDNIKSIIKPDHIFLVIDAMIGQDAVKTAEQFNKRLDINSFILTKLDGDARGGAALSIRQITAKAISFVGMGEDLNSLEVFRPEGLASRILGMGDIVSLAKDFEKHVNEKDAEEDMKRLIKGSFSFNDFIKQLNMMRKIGSFQSIIERLPGMGDLLPKGSKIDEREFIKFESMIFSMTQQERNLPDLLLKEKNRRQRIASGSGRKLPEVDSMIERFMFMRKMMQLAGKNPQALAQMPMFKNINLPSKHQQKFSNLRPPDNNKKDKRKTQKLARKKNKKR